MTDFLLSGVRPLEQKGEKNRFIPRNIAKSSQLKTVSYSRIWILVFHIKFVYQVLI